jgi:hypothetical protein
MDCLDYVFGYGSIIQDDSRLGTLGTSEAGAGAGVGTGAGPLEASEEASGGAAFTGGRLPGDRACAARLIDGGGAGGGRHCRSWSFRSSSGFTGKSSTWKLL